MKITRVSSVGWQKENGEWMSDEDWDKIPHDILMRAYFLESPLEIPEIPETTRGIICPVNININIEDKNMIDKENRKPDNRKPNEIKFVEHWDKELKVQAKKCMEIVNPKDDCAKRILGVFIWSVEHDIADGRFLGIGGINSLHIVSGTLTSESYYANVHGNEVNEETENLKKLGKLAKQGETFLYTLYSKKKLIRIETIAVFEDTTREKDIIEMDDEFMADVSSAMKHINANPLETMRFLANFGSKAISGVNPMSHKIAIENHLGKTRNINAYTYCDTNCENCNDSAQCESPINRLL